MSPAAARQQLESKPSMRLFIAVDISETVRDAVVAATAALKQQLDRAGVDRRAVRWVHPEHLHLTLRFLGEVAEEQTEHVRAALVDPFTVAPFPLTLDGFGVFPPSGSARTIWIDVSEGASELVALSRELERRLATVQCPAEPRPFRAHLTVGRLRWPDRRVSGSLCADVPPVSRTCTVDCLTLYQSRLSPDGPSYTPIVRAPLASGRRTS